MPREVLYVQVLSSFMATKIIWRSFVWLYEYAEIDSRELELVRTYKFSVIKMQFVYFPPSK